MIITKIQFGENQRIHTNNNFQTQHCTKLLYNTDSIDCFLKSPNNTSLKEIETPRKNVSFLGGVAYISYEFEKKFPKSFFKKLLREGIPDAYSDIELIPREDIDIIKSQGILKIKSSSAIKILKEYRTNMFDIEKNVLSILETLSKKHPEFTLQELLQLKYPQAEKVLIKQQSNVLNKINMIIRKLPKNEYLQMRKLIQESFNKIFEPNPTPEERFGRKIFINKLKQINISDQNIRNKIIAVAEKLPQSSNSLSAFIVKYSQPYKLRYNYETQTYTRIPRDSEELGLRLLEPSVGTDDHIHPQTAFRKEHKARLNGDETAKDMSTFRVTILTSRRMNEAKTDTALDNFIKQQNNQPIKYIQNQIKKLISIAQKWSKNGRNRDAAQLSDYILVLKEEIERRSNLVKIDLGNFETEIPKIKVNAQITEEKHRIKRLKKSGHADNTHSEHYMERSGRILENRKVQKHSSRFSN